MKKMEYKGRQWHELCFCCCICAEPIGTKSFIPKVSNHHPSSSLIIPHLPHLPLQDNEIFCTQCYEDKFATRCIKCSKSINAGGVTYRNSPWHKECFTCTNCNTCLAGQRFTSREEKPYCADCFGDLFAKKCASCSKPITGDTLCNN